MGDQINFDPKITHQNQPGGVNPAKPEKKATTKAAAYSPVITPPLQDVEFYCDDPGAYPTPEERHWCWLEVNWQKRDGMRRKGVAKTIEIIDKTLGLVDKTSNGADGTVKDFLFSAGRRVNVQADNWILLDAARKCVDMYNYSHGEAMYLEKAEIYLQAALANKNETISFDIFRFSWEDIFAPTIHPIEGYFELQLALFDLLSRTDPLKNLELGKNLEAELKDQRFLQAQGSNTASAEGYTNRLYVLYGFAGLYNPQMDPAQALEHAQEALIWTEKKHDDPLIDLSVVGMNKMDLRYDALLSQLITARLQVKLAKDDKDLYDEAMETFKVVFNEPEATLKYGGFLDIGLKAFFGIIHICLATSTSLEEAALKIEREIDWDQLASPEMVDFRESLGLIIREKKLRDEFSEMMRVDLGAGMDEAFGDYSLILDYPGLAPEDTTPIKSELNLADYESPEAKLELLMQLIDYIELPYDQKAQVIFAYNMLRKNGGVR